MDYTYFNRRLDRTTVQKPTLEFNGYFDNTQFQPTQGTSEKLLYNLSPDSMSNPNNWVYNYGQEPPATTEQEARVLEQELAIISNTVLNNALTAGGVDPSKGILLRQMMGNPGFANVTVPGWDISPDTVAVKESAYQQLLQGVTPEDLGDPEVSAYVQKEHNDLVYMHSVLQKRQNTESDFDYPSYSRASGSTAGGMLAYLSDGLQALWDAESRERWAVTTLKTAAEYGLIPGMPEPARTKIESALQLNVPGTLQDIEQALTTRDPNFNHERWYNEELTKNPMILQGLLDMGISKEMFYGLPNKNAAMFRLASHMNVTKIHERLQSYDPGTSWISPSWYGHQLKIIKDGFLNNIDTPILIGGDILLTAVGSAIAGSVAGPGGTAVGATAGTVAGVATGVSRVWTILKGTGSTAWHLGLGGLPSYGRQWGIIRPLMWHFGQGAGFMTAWDIAGQKNNIAFANSVYSLNPDMKTTVDYTEVAHSAVMGGLFTASFSLLHGTISEVWGRSTGKVNTPLNRTRFNLLKWANKADIADLDEFTKLVHDSVATDTQPTVEKLNHQLKVQAEALETTKTVTEGTVATSHDHPLSKRMQDEETHSWVIRTASSGTLDNAQQVIDAVVPTGVEPTQSHLKVAMEAAAEVEKLEIAYLTAQGADPALIAKRKQVHQQIKTELTAKADVTIDLPVVEVSPVEPKVEGAAQKLAKAITDTEETKPEQPTVEPTKQEPTLDQPSVPVAKKPVVLPVDAAEKNKNEAAILGRARELIGRNLNFKDTVRRAALGRMFGRQLTKKQHESMMAILFNPEQFIEAGMVQGKAQYITGFYRNVQGLVKNGVFTPDEARIILALSSSLTFNIPTPKMSVGARGAQPTYKFVSQEITIPLPFKGAKGPTAQVLYFLHELGHFLEDHLFGNSLLEVKKLITHDPDLVNSLQKFFHFDENTPYFLSSGEVSAEGLASVLFNEGLYQILLAEHRIQHGAIVFHVNNLVGSTLGMLIRLANEMPVGIKLPNKQLHKVIIGLIEEFEKIAQPAISRHAYTAYVQRSLREVFDTMPGADPQNVANFLNKIITELYAKQGISQPNQALLFTAKELDILRKEWDNITQRTASDSASLVPGNTNPEQRAFIEAWAITKSGGFSIDTNPVEFLTSLKNTNNHILNYLHRHKGYYYSEPGVTTDILIRGMWPNNQDIVAEFHSPIRHTDITTHVTEPFNKALESSRKFLRENGLFLSDEGAEIKPDSLVALFSTLPGSFTFKQLQTKLTDKDAVLLLSRPNVFRYLRDTLFLEKNTLEQLAFDDPFISMDGPGGGVFSWKGRDFWEVSGIPIKKNLYDTLQAMDSAKDVDPVIKGVFTEFFSILEASKLGANDNIVNLFQDRLKNTPVFILTETNFKKLFPKQAMKATDSSVIYLSDFHIRNQTNEFGGSDSGLSLTDILTPEEIADRKPRQDKFLDLTGIEKPLRAVPDKNEPLGAIGIIIRSDIAEEASKVKLSQDLIHGLTHVFLSTEMDAYVQLDELNFTVMKQYDDVSMGYLFSDLIKDLKNTLTHNKEDLLDTAEFIDHTVPQMIDSLKNILVDEADIQTHNLMVLYLDYLNNVGSNVLNATNQNLIEVINKQYRHTLLFQDFFAEAVANPGFREILQNMSPSKTTKKLLETVVSARVTKPVLSKLKKLAKKLGLADTKQLGGQIFQNLFGGIIEQRGYEKTLEWTHAVNLETLGNPLDEFSELSPHDSIRDEFYSPHRDHPSLPANDIEMSRKLNRFRIQLEERAVQQQKTTPTRVLSLLAENFGFSQEILNTLSVLSSWKEIMDTVESNTNTRVWVVDTTRGGLVIPPKATVRNLGPKTAAKVILNQSVLEKAKKLEAADTAKGAPITFDDVISMAGDWDSFLKRLSRRATKVPLAIRRGSNFQDLVSTVLANFIETAGKSFLKDNPDINLFLNRFAKAVERAGIKEMEATVLDRRAGLNPTNFKEYIEKLNSTLPPDKQVKITYDEASTNTGSELWLDFEKRYGKKQAIVSLEATGTNLEQHGGVSHIISNEAKVAAKKRGQVLTDVTDKITARNGILKLTELDQFILEKLKAGTHIADISNEASKQFKRGTSVSNINKRIAYINRALKNSLADTYGPEVRSKLDTVKDDDALGMLAALDSDTIQHAIEQADSTTPNPKLDAEQTDIHEAVTKHTKEDSPNITTELPVAIPEDSSVPVMGVVLGDQTQISGLTPAVPLSVAEKVVRTSKKVKKYVSVGVNKVIKFTSGHHTKFLSPKFGLLDGRIYPALADIEGILESIEVPSLDVPTIVKNIRSMFAAGKVQEGIDTFLEIMKTNKIDGVHIFGKVGKDGRTVILRRFVFDTANWNYGSYVHADPLPVVRAPKPVAEKPKLVTKEKPSKVAEPPKEKTLPTAVAPTGTKEIPVIAPKEDPAPKVDTSAVVKMSETDQLAMAMKDGSEVFEDSGIETTAFRRMLKMYLTAAKKAGLEIVEQIPNGFRKAFVEFIDMNSRIMEFNRNRFRDPKIVQRFWAEVHKIQAKEESLNVSVKNRRTYKTKEQIYSEAADRISTATHKFIPPIPEFSVRFTLDGNTMKLEWWSKTESVRKLVDPPEETVPKITKKTTEPTKTEDISVPSKKATDEQKVDMLLENAGKTSTRLLRGNNWFSYFIGGSERKVRNKWRRLMNGMRNVVNSGSGLSDTVNSLDSIMGLLSSLFDDTRVMTGTLVAPGNVGIRSFTRAHHETQVAILRMIRLYRALGQEMTALKLTPEEVRSLEHLFLREFHNNRLVDLKQLEAVFGSGRDYKKLQAVMSHVRQEMIHKNTELIELEKKTGWNSLTDADPNTYIPIQINPKVLKNLELKQREQLLSEMVRVRRASKLKNEKLDMNTLVVMGIADLADVDKLFTEDRIFVDSGYESTLSAETLANLKVATHDFTTLQDMAKMLDAIHGSSGRTYFTQISGKQVTVYRMPKVLGDLSIADQKKYLDTVGGSKDHVTEKWSQYLGTEDLISREMDELLDYKMKSGKYRRDRGVVINNRPDIAPHDDPSVTITVQNLLPTEVFQSDIILNITRTNMRAAYQNLLHSRLFDLKVQETIDQLVGHTGLRPNKLFLILEKKAKELIEQDTTLTDLERASRLLSVQDGINRLFWGYAEMNNTMLNNTSSAGTLASNATRSLRNVIGLRSLAWGMTSATESMLEVIKSSPRMKGFALPINMVQYLGTLLKIWDRKNPALASFVDDLATSLEDYSNEHVAHQVDGEIDVDLDIDGISYGSIFNEENTRAGPFGATAHLTGKAARMSLLAGGLQAVTQFTRGLSKVRHIGSITKILFNPKFQKFLELRADPRVAKVMDDYLKASFESAVDERKLAREFRNICREAGINHLTAVKMLLCGIDSVQNMEAIRWGLQELGMTGKRIDFIDLAQLYYQLKKSKDPKVNPETFRNAASRFHYGIENLIRKRSVSTPHGLNKALSSFHTSEAGKLMSMLVSWLRSWHNDTLLNAPERGSMGLIFGGLTAWATVELVTYTLREWLQGRDTEDIEHELRERPGQYIMKIASRLPVAGVFTPVTETASKYLIALQGGSQRSLNSVMQSMDVGGLGASTVSAMGRNIIGGIEEVSKGNIGKGIARTTQAFVPYNNTQYVLPARLLETMADLDEKAAFMQFQDMVQREPKPYGGNRQSSRAPGMPVQPGEYITTPEPRNITKELERTPRGSGAPLNKIPPPELKSQVPASKILAKLLEKVHSRSP